MNRFFLNRSIFKNHIFKNSIFGFLSFFLPFILMIIFTPLLINEMGESGYGLWILSTSFMGTLGIFDFGLSLALTKYVAEYSNSRKTLHFSSCISNTILINFFSGLIITAILISFAPEIAQLFNKSQFDVGLIQNVIKITAIGILPNFLKNAFLAIPKGLQHYKLVMFVTVFQNILMMIVTWLVVFNGGTILAAIVSNILFLYIFAFISAVYAKILVSTYKFRFLISKAMFKKLLNFSVYTGIMGVGRQIFNWVDRLIVGATLGFQDLTYYSVSIGVANKFMVVNDTLTHILFPVSSAIHAQKKTNKLKYYFRSSLMVISSITLFVLIFLLIFSEDILTIWMGSDFAENSLASFRLLLFIYAIMSVTAPAYHILNGVGKPIINMWGAILGGGGTIVGILLLSPKMGIEGASLANMASWTKFISVFYAFRILKFNLNYN